jgi:fumarate reductase flavoprotein subunit
MAPSAAAQEQAHPPVLLLQKHLGQGLSCAACHDETPPTKAATTAKCLSCHGTYDALADKTEGKGGANPHDSHQGELGCASCHHVHKLSVNFCSQCHQFNFNVP